MQYCPIHQRALMPAGHSRSDARFVEGHWRPCSPFLLVCAQKMAHAFPRQVSVTHACCDMCQQCDADQEHVWPR